MIEINWSGSRYGYRSTNDFGYDPTKGMSQYAEYVHVSQHFYPDDVTIEEWRNDEDMPHMYDYMIRLRDVFDDIRNFNDVDINDFDVERRPGRGILIMTGRGGDFSEAGEWVAYSFEGDWVVKSLRHPGRSFVYDRYSIKSVNT
jgi:hypothetical protein